MPLYDFLTGPMMWVTVALFVSGMVYKAIRLRQLASLVRPANDFFNPNASFKKSFKTSLPGRYPVTTIVSIVFHLILFVVPLFLKGHNILLDASLGISLPMMPDHTADNLTMICICCCLFFLLRRLLVRRVRVISFFSDYLILAIVILPFLTGFIAYHRLLPYDTVLNLHIITGQLMLVAMPYTRLAHMIVFFIMRMPRPTARLKLKESRGTI